MASETWAGLVLIVFFVAIGVIIAVISFAIMIFCCKAKKNKRAKVMPTSQNLRDIRSRNEATPRCSDDRVEEFRLEDENDRRDRLLQFKRTKQVWMFDPT
ncbi:uncharacterized protein [Argopecten irradians]|uniref:uncharacterized protein n=1 Tax=Argopecten irradians TaxID=31199 RepID=UPI00371AEA4F